MKETAPEKDAVSMTKDWKPSQMVAPDSERAPFYETDLPLGEHTRYFLIDFLLDLIEENRLALIDSNVKVLRNLILKTEQRGFEVTLSGIQISLWFKFNNQPEEWEVTL